MNRSKLWILVSALMLLASCSRDSHAQAQRYLENGNKFFAKDKFKEASIMYRKALQKDLRFGEAYYRLALTDLKLAAYSDAVRMLLVAGNALGIDYRAQRRRERGSEKPVHDLVLQRAIDLITSLGIYQKR